MHDDVHPGLDQGLDPRLPVGAHPDGGPHPQAAELVLAGQGILADFFDVLDGDEPVEVAVVVHHQQFFNAVLMEQGLGLLQGDPHLGGDQVVLGHHLFDLLLQVGFKAQVPVGDDAHQFLPLHHRDAGDAVALHQLQDIGDPGLGPDGHRVDDHPGLRLFDLFRLQGLGLDGHVAVQDADAALAGQGDGRVRLGHRVHGGTDEGNVEGDAPGQAGAEVRFTGQHRRGPRQQQQIIESVGIVNAILRHTVYPPAFEFPVARFWSHARRNRVKWLVSLMIMIPSPGCKRMVDYK